MSGGIEVDIQAKQALVLNLAILSNHKDTFFSDQMVDAISDFLDRLC